MDLHKLRTFSAVATEGNVTRAARRLATSQPAVSKHVSDLEEALGVLLFDRLPRGVRLTEAGRILLEHAQRIFAAEGAAEEEIAELKGLLRGRLSIGASTTIGSYLIPSVFGAFHRRHPDVLLELEIANTAAIQAMVIDHRIDLGLTEGFVPAEQLDVEVVHYDEMVAIAHAEHPLMGRPRLKIGDLAHFPFICRERGSGTRDVVEAALADKGLSFEPVMSLGSTEAVKNAVAAGLGVAFVSRLTVELELSSGRLAVLQVQDLSVRRALHMVRLKGRRNSHAAETFIRQLRAALKE